MAKLVLRFDDIVPQSPWSRIATLEHVLNDLGLRPIMGVVPDNRDSSLKFGPPRSDFWDIVRRWHGQGWTIAQHGYQHLYTTNGRNWMGRKSKSEFVGYSLARQMDMLERGKAIMQTEGVWTGVFMAPAHSFDSVTLAALEDLQFRALTDGWGVYPYRVGSLSLLPQLLPSTRSAGPGVFTGCFHLGTMSERQFAALLRDIHEAAPRTISFEEALCQSVPPVIPSLLRVLSRHGLPLYTRIRTGVPA